MEPHQLAYLTGLDATFRSAVESLTKKAERERLFLFVTSLLVLASSLASVRIEEISSLGVKVSSIDVSRVVILLPLLLSYQYALYSSTRRKERERALQHRSLVTHIEKTLGIDVSSLVSTHVYRSGRGTVYRYQQQDRPQKLGAAFLKAISWLPFSVAFLMSLSTASSEAYKLPSSVGRVLGIGGVVASLIVVVSVRLAFRLAYCESRKLPKNGGEGLQST